MTGIRKPSFGRRIISSGKVAGRRPLQRVLRLAVPDLQRPGQTGDVLDDVGVEKRAPHLERMRHRQPVDERQHLVGEDAAELRLEHAIQRVARRQPVEGLPHVLARGDAGERGAHVAANTGRTSLRRSRTSRRERHSQSVQALERRDDLGACGHAMRQVAAEQLVGAVAGDRHLDVLRHALREEVGRHDARERLVERAQDRAEALGIAARPRSSPRGARSRSARPPTAPSAGPAPSPPSSPRLRRSA